MGIADVWECPLQTPNTNKRDIISVVIPITAARIFNLRASETDQGKENL